MFAAKKSASKQASKIRAFSFLDSSQDISFISNKFKTSKTIVSATLSSLILLGCAQMNVGSQSAKTEATGSAGGANTTNANKTLEKCDKPLGTVAVIEDQNAGWYTALSGKYGLGSTVPILKLLVQQSNCFMVVDRGSAMQVTMGERNLRDSGELRQSSNFNRGQMVAADYSLSPSVTFSNNDAGGGGAAGLATLGFPLLGILAGSLKFSEASTLLTLSDNRSSIQVAAAEGSAKNMDLGILGGAFGSSLGGVAGGYSNTAEGKVVVAAFTDSFNNIVKAVRNYKPQMIEGGLGTGGALPVHGGTKQSTGASTKPVTKKSSKKTTPQ